ncbi:rhodanese-like domain-containing protein [Aestuariibacter sp. AA17]|uniref:Rhodanese-like domain-containing protein n=1 Tax=Fluctibacter corallii TaxID=2984329 RepID=A0ABT3A4U4_9ALTE|nr:rhodanese-like domain-containing protein [Aestuariibacter sp. AA17]MCV2883705.1 rhodanese-like domain-containing protein [Aestuariibacter sp. AA17]
MKVALVITMLFSLLLASPNTIAGGDNSQANHDTSTQLQSLSQAQFLSQKEQDWLVLDVRSEEEYQAGHIPEAKNIPHVELKEVIASISEYKHKPVVVYCRSGRRAKIAADILLANGFQDVLHLEGDMKGWEAAGHTIAQ